MSIGELYSKMLYLRLFEKKVIELYPEQEMKTPVHLGIGQEAVSVGFLFGLEDDDVVYSNHRSHLHYLAKGGNPYALAAELYGKADGCSKGRGGSMHVVDARRGLMGSSSIVSGGVPIAVGAALGFKLQLKDLVSIVFFGDGAIDEGVVYESMSFSALKKLPIIFVVENNGYATASLQRARQPLDNIYERGGIFGIPGYKVNGNDVVEVKEVADMCIAKARSGKGPSLVECKTYRWKGHVGIHEDAEYRTTEEIAQWKKKCPINLMITKYNIVRDDSIGEQMRHEIDSIFKKAKIAPYPPEESLLELVFSEEL
jgi:pyruvate dehydrogenase E1 component alpha subunit